MNAKIIFLVEEPSMGFYLKEILPRIIPSQIQFQIVPHQGKRSLQGSIPKKLLPRFQQQDASRVGKCANIEENTSPSFRCFVDGVKKICEELS